MREEICSKLENLKSYVKELHNLRGLNLSELKNKPIERAAVERFFQMAIESVIDICSMIISYEDMEKPDEYRKVILLLGKIKILKEDFARSFSDVAGFRNILVHQYAQVDAAKLHEFLDERLDDFEYFAKQVAKYINRKKENS